MTPTLTETCTPVLTIRQTHLRWALRYCRRGAHALAVEQVESVSGGEALRGTAIHEFFAAYNNWLYTSGRKTDWTEADQILADVLKAYPGLSFADRMDVRDQAKKIAASYVLDCSHYYGAEEHLETDITLNDGRVVRVTGTLDLLLVDADAHSATVRDVKSAWKLPPDSEVASDEQLMIYAMLVLDNLPHIDAVKGELWFTRYDMLVPRKGEARWTREDIQPFREHIRVVLADLLDSRTHEANPTARCQYCPLRHPKGCTVWRTYKGVVPPPPLTYYQVRRLARQVIALEQAREVRLQRIKEYVDANGPFDVTDAAGAETFAYHKRESEEIPATALLQILEDNFGLVGPQPLDELLQVKKTTKTYKALRYHKELRSAFDDAAQTKVSTTFGHKARGGDDE